MFHSLVHSPHRELSRFIRYAIQPTIILSIRRCTTSKVFASAAVKRNQTLQSEKQFMKQFQSQSEKQVLVQQYQFVLMKIASCTLYTIHDFHLGPEIQIARVFAAQIFGCHLAL